MKIKKPLTIITLLLACSMVSGCCRSKDEVWDDTKTASRHMKRGLRTLGGKNGDSRAIHCREDFMALNEDDLDFIPLYDDENMQNISMSNAAYRQPKEAPGDRHSSLPGIDGFTDPSQRSDLSQVFRTVHYPYDSSQIKGEENLKIVRNVANYMKKHPNTYIYVEGHCDERGAQAYNLPLGSRRSNAVRNQLIEQGVSPDNIFTVSYGKERPVDSGHGETAWAKNRRAEFKVYERH